MPHILYLYISFKVLDQLNSLLKSEQDGLKMNIEEWGGGTLSLGPCFPNPGTLLAMPCLRDFEVGSPGTSLPDITSSFAGFGPLWLL